MFSRSMQVISASLIILSIVLLIGCGGGNGVSNAGGSTAITITAARTTGRAVLPAGSMLQPTTLTVSSGVDHVLLHADGSFSLRAPGEGQALATLQDASGKILLLGFIDGANTGLSKTRTRVAR